MPAATSLYAVLGVGPTADGPTIKAAYRKKLLQDHPDKGGAKHAFQRIKEAYEVLGDAKRRGLYDKFGSGVENAGQENMRNSTSYVSFATPTRRDRLPLTPLASTHSNPRSGTGGETPTRGRRVTADVRFPLKVNLQELYFGCAKKLRINRTVICNHCAGCGARPGALPNTKYGETLCKLCGGSGIRVFEQMAYSQGTPGRKQQMQTVCSRCKGLGVAMSEDDLCGKCNGKRVVVTPTMLEVKVERGAREGQKIILPGMANERPGLRSGDVVVVVSSTPHGRFGREGDDLVYRHNLSLAEAFGLADGGNVRFLVEHLDGRRVAVQTQRGVIRPGDMRHIQGEGMPVPASTRARGQPARGVLRVVFEVPDFPVCHSPDDLSQRTEALREQRGDSVMRAAFDGRADDLRSLLHGGGGRSGSVSAQLTMKDGWGRNALHLAAESDTAVAAAPAVVSLLLDAGLDVNAGDEWGCSPLHLACRALYPAVVSKLLAGGADVGETNSQGLDPVGELERTARAAASRPGGLAAVTAIREAFDGHAACRWLQRLQVLQWSTGALHYRAGRNSAMALELPSSLVERIAAAVCVAATANRTAAAPSVLERFEAQGAQPRTLKKCITSDAAEFEVKIESVGVAGSTISNAATEGAEIGTSTSWFGASATGGVTVYICSVTTSTGRRQRRLGPAADSAESVERLEVYRRYSQFEQLHNELIEFGERGRLRFEDGDERHRREVAAALGKLRLPEKRYWHSGSVVSERVAAFDQYLGTLCRLQLHSPDVRGILFAFLGLETGRRQ